MFECLVNNLFYLILFLICVRNSFFLAFRLQANQPAIRATAKDTPTETPIISPVPPLAGGGTTGAVPRSIANLLILFWLIALALN